MIATAPPSLPDDCVSAIAVRTAASSCPACGSAITRDNAASMASGPVYSVPSAVISHSRSAAADAARRSRAAAVSRSSTGVPPTSAVVLSELSSTMARARGVPSPRVHIGRAAANASSTMIRMRSRSSQRFLARTSRDDSRSALCRYRTAGNSTRELMLRRSRCSSTGTAARTASDSQSGARKATCARQPRTESRAANARWSGMPNGSLVSQSA